MRSTPKTLHTLEFSREQQPYYKQQQILCSEAIRYPACSYFQVCLFFGGVKVGFLLIFCVENEKQDVLFASSPSPVVLRALTGHRVLVGFCAVKSGRPSAVLRDEWRCPIIFIMQTSLCVSV